MLIKYNNNFLQYTLRAFVREKDQESGKGLLKDLTEEKRNNLQYTQHVKTNIEEDKTKRNV